MRLTLPLLALLLAATPLWAKAPGFEPRRVVRAFPAIKNAPSIPAARVIGQVTDSELVIGVQIGEAARAYPVNMLTGPDREIINDTLGGVPIAATW